jgi:type I restriction enzyme S subunit
MSEWIEAPLSQLVTFQKGRKVDTSSFVGEGFAAYLGASGIEGGNDGYAATQFAVLAKPTDTLMLWDGERSGLVGFGKQGVVASTVSKLAPNERIDPQYLFFALSDRFGWIQHRRTGTGVPHVPKDLGRILNLRYPKAPSVQQKIAAILTATDAAIEKTSTLIDKYQQIKAGLMHDLFTRGVLPNGQLRLPREQAPELYQETAIGWIPREWACERLGAILLKSGGYLQTGPFGSQLHADEYNNEGVPVVMPQDISDGLIDTVSIARITEARANSLARHRLKVGDIIIARRGELSRAAAISNVEVNWICGTGCFLLRLGRTELNHFFLSHVYRYDFVQRQIAGMQVGTTMPSLNNSVMSRVFFPFPPPAEQNKITKRLNISEAEINSLRNHAEKLRQQKLGLMQDLLTGKVPVTVDELEAADA